MLAKIHIMSKQLRLDETTYRDLLKRVTGKDSAGDMDMGELHQVIAELVRLGGRADAREKVPLPGAPKSLPTEVRAMLVKVELLLRHGKRDWHYAHALAKRMFECARVEWLPPAQLHKLVAALEYDKRRREAKCG
jgi:phage gp16-like protein